MAKKKPTAVKVQEQEIAGQSVRIETVGDQERLLIDGSPTRFHKTNAGYVLQANMYVEPTDTLLEAVKKFLERESDPSDD